MVRTMMIARVAPFTWLSLENAWLNFRAGRQKSLRKSWLAAAFSGWHRMCANGFPSSSSIDICGQLLVSYVWIEREKENRQVLWRTLQVKGSPAWPLIMTCHAAGESYSLKRDRSTIWAFETARDLHGQVIAWKLAR